MKIETTSVKQEANKVMGTDEKVLYYLLVTNNKGEKLVINVGQKTHDGVQKLLQTENKI